MYRLKKLGLAILIAFVAIMTSVAFCDLGLQKGSTAYAAGKKKTESKKKTITSSTKLNITSKTLGVGETLQLKVLGNKKKVTWSTSNKNIATVTKSGKVTTVADGTVKITAKIAKKKYICKIKVKVPVISANTLKLNEGEKAKLSFKNNKKKIAWFSSDKSVATVDNKGNILAKKEGNAAIEAYIAKVGYFSCHLAVKNPNNNDTTVIKAGQLGLFTLEISSHWSISYRTYKNVDSGLYIINISRNSPLYNKLHEEDIVTKINNTTLTTQSSLTNELKKIKSNSKVNFTCLVKKGNKYVEKKLTVTMKTRYYIDGLKNEQVHLACEKALGIFTVQFSDDCYFIPKGVWVGTLTENSILKDAGLYKNDVLTKVESYPIESINDLEKFYTDKKSVEEFYNLVKDKGTIEFTVKRVINGEYQEVKLTKDISNLRDKLEDIISKM